jgi:hypothetical protein
MSALLTRGERREGEPGNRRSYITWLKSSYLYKNEAVNFGRLDFLDFYGAGVTAHQ